MAKPKKGQKMVCAPCGREVVISACGVSKTTIWCCGRPMKSKTAAKKKAVSKKKAAPKKKTAAKKKKK